MHIHAEVIKTPNSHNALWLCINTHAPITNAQTHGHRSSPDCQDKMHSTQLTFTFFSLRATSPKPRERVVKEERKRFKMRDMSLWVVLSLSLVITGSLNSFRHFLSQRQTAFEIWMVRLVHFQICLTQTKTEFSVCAVLYVWHYCRTDHQDVDDEWLTASHFSASSNSSIGPSILQWEYLNP